MPQSISLNSQNKYEIKVHGQLDESWLNWFGDAKIHVETLADSNQMTTFSNVVMDQAGLVGLVRQLHGRGIVLISIVGREPGDPAGSQNVPDQNEVLGKTK